MDVVFVRCAGIDVHKKFVMVALRIFEEGRCVPQEVRRFGTMTGDLCDLSEWLFSLGVTHVAMESTGVLWRPIYNVLGERFSVLLCNARHLKRVPGRKTDVKDCQWIAQLLSCGLLQGSFIPPRPVQELRDLTRHRACLVGDVNRVKNRIQKVLEDANVKLSCVASDPFGASGRAILVALIGGEEDGAKLADLARASLRRKRAELTRALEGRVREHHRLMLRLEYRQLVQLEAQIAEVEKYLGEYMQRPEMNEPVSSENPSAPFEDALELVQSIPGVNRIVGASLLAETGTDMTRFPTSGHLASWAGLCPGTNESAGKQKSTRISKGNPWVRRAITQAAWAATRKKDSFLKAQYNRIAARRGKKRALIAVAHSLLVIIHELLSNGMYYHEAGADFYDKLHRERITKNLVKRLERMGHKVSVEVAA